MPIEPRDPHPLPPTPGPDDVPRPEPMSLGLAGDPRPDILRFLMVQRAWAPSLNPIGSHLAFRSDMSGRPQLWITDTQGVWPVQLTFGESVTFHAWSPAGDLILYGSDRGGNEREGYFVITPDGTRERELLAPSGGFRVFGGFSPDGARIAYAATSGEDAAFDIHLLEVATGRDRTVLEGRMGLYVAAWRPDGRALLLTETRGEDSEDVHLLDLATGELRPLFRPVDPSHYTGFSFSPDGAHLFLATDQDRDHAALARCEVATGKLTFLETPDCDVDDAALSRDGRFLAWLENAGGWSRLRARDLRSGRELPAPRLPRGVHAIGWAHHVPTLAVAVNGPRVPGDVWIWDAADESFGRATHSSVAGLDMETMRSPVHLDFPARDGVELHGLLYLPHGDEDEAQDVPLTPGTPASPPEASADAHRGGEKPPVLLAVHGGPTAQARPNFNPVHQYLLKRGIAVFDLNFRGSTGYGKRFARLDNLRLRPNAVRDMEDALDFLAADGRVDAGRAAVMGGSYGGFMTLAALTAFPGRFRAGVAIVGVSNWLTALEGASPQLKAGDRLEYGDVDDPGDRAFLVELSPITHVRKVRDPLMVIHGANDPRDPVSESDQFVGAVRAQGGAVEYLRFPDEGHGVRKLDNRVIAYRRVARFLERHLGLDPE